MIRKLFVLQLLAASWITAIAYAADSPEAPSEVIRLRRCKVDYDQTTRLGPRVPGVLRETLVRLGDQTKAGQVLGRLEDREIRAEVELLTADAESDVEIRVSKAKLDLASAKLERTESLRRRDRNLVSIEAYNVDLTEKQTAELG